MKKQTSILCLALMVLVAQSAQAQLRHYTAFMDGPSENPPVPSPGTGAASIVLDLGASPPTMRVLAEFRDLVAPTTVAHIHCCVDPPGNVGVATPTPTFPGFPGGVTFGSYDQTFDMTNAASYNPSFIANFGGGTTEGSLATLLAGLEAGQAYFNIHTSQFPGGEIRGFLVFVPEPGAAVLAGFALIGLALRRRR